MGMFALVLYLFIYYVRPQEWISWMAALKPVKMVMALSILSIFIERQGLGIKDILKTPHDWMMHAFNLYLIFWAGSSLGGELNKIVLYMVLVLVLTNMKRVKIWMYVWMGWLIWVACFALLTKIGIDPTGVKGVIEGQFSGRILIGTSLFNNANSLGHSVYPAVLLIFFLMVWKSNPVSKAAGVFLMIFPILCVYFTESKGSFIAGFAAATVSMLLGRSRITQVTTIVLAATLGWGIIQSLPRMDELKNVTADEAINARIEASRHGLIWMNEYEFGVGKDKFRYKFGREVMLQHVKASHSSYVQVGSETGQPGFFIYLGIIYCSLRVLLTVKTNNKEEERLQRALFAYQIGWMASSWIVDLGFRNEYYMLAGTIAAFHRCLIDSRQDEGSKEHDELLEEDEREIVAAADRGSALSHVADEPTPAAGDATADSSEQARPYKLWSHLGWKDFVAMYIFFRATIIFWEWSLDKITAT